MFTRYDEQVLVEKLAKKYLEMADKYEEFYSLYDLFCDVHSDEIYEDLEQSYMIDISKEDLMTMCRDEYEAYFRKPCTWGFLK